MKVEPECASCILYRAQIQVYQATTNPALRFRCMSEIVKLINRDFKPSTVAADISTTRDRIIRQLTSNSDPYKQVKKQANEKALKLLPQAKKFVLLGHTQQERFKKACLCAIVGNIMEFDIPGHKYTLKSLSKIIKDAAKDLVIDDIDQAYEITKKANSVLFLADNAGEIVFDSLLVEQLKNMGLKVTYVVKGGPVINDATLEDVELSNIDKLADEVITTGADAIGLIKKHVSPEFLKIYEEAELVFAKGMGYAETITEYKYTKPHLHLLRTKCTPVANYFCVPRDKNIAKLVS
ncbi:MAG: ARMT1-like domain-containing protein [Nitrososphaerota archaeon]|uniref:damage-control phosphatase ARMT1 family protein n=1 Tax=Candidatus Bathycorpusculum sp. TaxID=2994959 RepID=UPI00281C4C51|nr:ARMT1-like domain-containing protein [Candidatus Termiticorpusculum sp.]MCL2257520.1 ARMT1-like domain-containing protein [Candidatus Termiticorpusculum sp.]MCL2292344.1 ARMT1-like domain-containing protein [Candidatus Termiticorpusculum sp.]MDR0460738.1 ARMT1-like domain-containing protein [Nitrososphaerota archaeon]